MQLPLPATLSDVPALIQRDFALERVFALWNSIEPRGYPRTLQPWMLATAVLGAFLERLSGLRQILARWGGQLGVSSISTLSDALANPRFGRFMASVVAMMEESDDWTGLGERDLVAVDTTWLSLSLTQRWRGLRKIASNAVGLGAMIALRLDGGRYPLRLLGILHGAANDTKPVRFVHLLACGPTYVMDRGFYSMQTVAHWIANDVRFIVRAKARCLKYRVEQVLSPPQRAGLLDIVEDAIVVLGAENTRLARSTVRLVRARRRCDGEEIIVISGNMEWTAAELLAAYKRRWEIEDFFLFLKEHFGMAHLYSFSATAMESLLRLALLGIGMLLHEQALAEQGEGDKVTKKLYRALKAVRRLLGVPPLWKPNTTRKRLKKKRRRKQLCMEARGPGVTA